MIYVTPCIISKLRSFYQFYTVDLKMQAKENRRGESSSLKTGCLDFKTFL